MNQALSANAVSTGAAAKAAPVLATVPVPRPSAATTTVATAPVKPAQKHITSTQVGIPTPQVSHSPATAGSMGSAFLALVLVIGLILALAWLAKRLPGVAGTSNPALRVVGSLSLGPRERLIVVAVGDTQLLLGVGATGTRMLHTLTEPLPVVAAATPAFAQILAQHFGKKA